MNDGLNGFQSLLAKLFRLQNNACDTVKALHALKECLDVAVCESTVLEEEATHKLAIKVKCLDECLHVAE